MNKELFVSSTPHETKVGLVEDDLLAEVYLERENEYTLAGSIYKGRVTRVLPGMQSAFVDIGLERDAFLYVSDFMDLEDHDDDLTDVVPANRGVQDMRPQPVRSGAAPASAEPVEASEAELQLPPETEESSEVESQDAGQPAAASESAEPSNGSDTGRDRGGYRGGRRRRRGGRRERGFDRGSERGNERSSDRGAERSFNRPVEAAPSRPSGPPAGYQPILLPGESISKYQRFSQAPVQEVHPAEEIAEVSSQAAAEATVPVAAAFPEDEPIFAADVANTEPLHEEHEEIGAVAEEPVDSAATSMSWKREFRRPEPETAVAPAWAEEEHAPAETTPSIGHEDVTEEHAVEERHEHRDQPVLRIDSEPPSRTSRDETPMFAAPGTMEEETIDDEEADTLHYEASSDDSFDEFEEETRAADQPEHLNGDAREAVSEIHMASISESGEHAAEAAPAEAEEDAEDMELEEAQAQAEALLDAEARGNGTVDARAEVRAPAPTAGYTQRSSRRFDRQYERRGGDRGRRGGGGGRRFRRREASPVPLISDLLKEGQEILVQIAKEPIGKKGARITSHIALPGRFLVYMPTVNHTGVSRKISSEEERQRLKRIILSEREDSGRTSRTAQKARSPRR